MVNTKLISIVSEYDTTIIGGTIVKAGNIVGFLKAGNVAEAKSILSKNKMIQLFNLVLSFAGFPIGVSKYDLESVGTLPSEGLSTYTQYIWTSEGAQMVKPKAPLKSVKVYNSATYEVVNGEIPSNDFLLSKSRYFTTGIFKFRNNVLLGKVLNGDKTVSGWIRIDQINYTPPTQVVTPVVKPTQIVVPVVVKPIVKPLINQPYDPNFFVVEPPKEEKNSIIPLLGILLSAITILK